MLTVKTAANHLGISASTLYAMASRREVPFFRVGGKILFKQEDLDAYLEGCRVGAATPVPPAPRVALALKHLSAR